MESITDDSPLIVVLGPTASGKTSISLRLAQHFDGEIIAADSRTIYRGMDIGTAKPSTEERAQIRHHLLDSVNPDESYSVADFQQQAMRAIDDIHARGKVPFLVGGTGLYIDSVIYGFGFRGPADPQQRAYLNSLDVEALQALLRDKSIPLPPNSRNPRHLIRAIETEGAIPAKQQLRPRTLVLGLLPDADVLQAAIAKRADKMIADGLVDEARGLADKYGWDAPGLRHTPAYMIMRQCIAGAITLAQAKALLIRSDRQYAKRQRTWFKRDKNITWISNPDKAVDIVTTFLNK